jgi:signal peptidase I
LLILVAVQALVLQVFLVPSASMATTVDSGDRVLVDKLAYRLGGLERGDIVVFDGDESWDMVTGATGDTENPENTENTRYMKRLIGLPGERVTCCDADGRLMIDGIPLDEPYLHPGDAPSEDRFDIRVPPDRVWVMGDHRSASADSRAHIGDPGGGAIPVDSIVGRVVAVVWPGSSAGFVDRPSTGPSIGPSIGPSRG